MVYQSSILSRHAGVISHTLICVGLDSEGNEAVYHAAAQVEALKCVCVCVKERVAE